MKSPATTPKPSDDMRIGIDGRNLQTAEGTGIATYATTLLQAIRSAGHATELLTDLGPHRSRADRYRAAFTARIGGVTTTLANPIGWNQTIGRLREAPDLFRCAQVHFDMWRRLLLVTGADLPDVMHWTAPLPLRMSGIPNIYTFHDAIPLRRPNRTNTNPARFRRLLHTIAATADHILVVSEATEREILAAVPALANRTSVIAQVVLPPPPAPDPVELARITRAIAGCAPDDYYLFCGTIEPRKNIPALIRAFRASGTARRLVLAGPDGWHAAEELGDLVGGAIIRVGYLNRDDLIALMRGARALLYPTLEEGFGLPIIEAMGVGTPVLTSAGGATGEVAGNAAALVDPTDTNDLATAIRRLDTDDALIAALGERGRARSRCFAPDAYARKITALYRSLRIRDAVHPRAV